MRATRAGWRRARRWSGFAAVLALVASVATVGTLAGTVSSAGASPAGTAAIAATGFGEPHEAVLGTDGSVWFSSSQGIYAGEDSISRLAPSGALTVYRGLAQVRGLAPAADGGLWFGQGCQCGIGKVSAAGLMSLDTDVMPKASCACSLLGVDAGTLYVLDKSAGFWRIPVGGPATKFGGGVGLLSATLGVAGAVWYLDDQHRISRVAADGTSTTFSTPGAPDPHMLAPASDGSLWFVTDVNVPQSFGHLSAAGVLTTSSHPDAWIIDDLERGPDGAIWFTSYKGLGDAGFTGASIGRVSTSGVSIIGHPDVDVISDVAIRADGTVWYTDSFRYTVGKMTPAGATSTVLRDLISFPTSITTGPDGNLWVTDSRTRINLTLFPGHDGILRFAPNGVATLFTSPTLAFPTSMVTGPDGTLWFVNRGNEEYGLGHDSIGRITPTGTISAFGVGTVHEATSIVPGPDDNLWFSNGSSIGRITSAGVITTYAGPPAVTPGDIVKGSDGALWFTNGASIGRITTAGAITTYPVPNAPKHLTAGADGNLWFTMAPSAGTVTIGRLTTAGTATTFPAAGLTVAGPLATGADGNVWVVGGPSTYARVTPAGAVTPFTSSAIRALSALGSGPDGRLWFVDLSAIGKINTASSADPPIAVVATPQNGAAKVSWTAPSVDPGAPVTGYTVTSSPEGKTCTWSSGPLSCTVSDLTNGVAYTFTVTTTTATVGTSGPSFPSAAVVPTRFTDVPFGAPFYADIDWMAGTGITTGYGDGTFHPGEAVQRQAMAAFLYRFKGSVDGPKPSCAAPAYTDVPASSPFCGEITWMKGQGITTGYPDGSFHPNDSVQRQAMAAFLYRAKGSPNGAHPTCSVKPFTDIPIDATFCGEIAWMKAAGISTGNADGTFAPGTPISRQAMAAFLHRLALLPT